MAAVLGVTLASGFLIGRGNNNDGPKTSNTVTTTAPTARALGPVRDGVYKVGFGVGFGVEPGTYRTDGPSGRGHCNWVRHGLLRDTIDSGQTSGSATVTIAPTDWGFGTEGCLPWTPA